MNTHTNKAKEIKSQSITNANFQLKNSNETTFQFVDNRATSITQQKLQEQPIQKKENNTGLSDTLKSGIENMSGYAMDDVKVHYNSPKPAQLNAHAYAEGTDIHVASGQEKHVPHEAWHVVQQKQGRVQPTTSFGGAQINDNVSLENEADVMGGKALQLKSDKDGSDTFASSDFQQNIQLKANKGAMFFENATIQRVEVADTLNIADDLLEETKTKSNQKHTFLVNDDESPSKGQVRVTNFLSALQLEVISMADNILNKVGKTTADCPYIPYWFNYYRTKNAQHVEQALERYTQERLANIPWGNYITIVVKAVKKGLENSLQGTRMEGVPDEIPQDLHVSTEGKTMNSAIIQTKPKQQPIRPVYTIADFETLMNTTVLSDQDKTVAEILHVNPDEIGMPNDVVIEVDNNIERVDEYRPRMVIPEPGTPINIEAGRLHFRNYYGEQVWIMDYNFKDPNVVEGQIRANEVVERQIQVLGINHGPRVIVRKNVISATGNTFFEEHQFDHNQEMTADQFHEFMLTANGKSTHWVLNSVGCHASGARVIKTIPGRTEELSVVITVEEGRIEKYW